MNFYISYKLCKFNYFFVDFKIFFQVFLSKTDEVGQRRTRGGKNVVTLQKQKGGLSTINLNNKISIIN